MRAVVSALESTMQTTHIWLNELLDLLQWPGDQHRAYLALRSVLHALRNRLPMDNAVSLAAQLPMLVRGFYYEGWDPHGMPVKERKQEEFLSHVQADFKDDP